MSYIPIEGRNDVSFWIMKQTLTSERVWPKEGVIYEKAENNC